MASDSSYVAVQMLMTEPVTERLRCVRLATGQIVFEFWTDGKRVGRIDADAYEAALDMAREAMQDEERPTTLEVAQATTKGPPHAS